jgi:hypothetical protein
MHGLISKGCTSHVSLVAKLEMESVSGAEKANSRGPPQPMLMPLL